MRYMALPRRLSYSSSVSPLDIYELPPAGLHPRVNHTVDVQRLHHAAFLHTIARILPYLPKQTSGTRIKTLDCCAGRGRGERGVPGAQPHDQTVSLPQSHPHVGLHLLLLVEGQQPGGQGRQTGRGLGVSPAC